MNTEPRTLNPKPSTGPTLPWTTLRRTTLRRTTLPRTAQNFALFFPSPTTIFILLSLLWCGCCGFCWFELPWTLSLCVLSLNLGGVFEGRDPEMCTFGLSGCRVKPRRLQGRRGFTRNLRTPNSRPRRFKHQNSTEGPPREGEKN